MDKSMSQTWIAYAREKHNLAEQNYSSAVRYYDRLKEQFLKNAFDAQTELQDEAYMAFIDSLNFELQEDLNENLEKSENIAKLYEKLEEYAEIFVLNGYEDTQLIEAIQNKRFSGKEDIRLYSNRLKEDFKTFFDGRRMNAAIKTTVDGWLRDAYRETFGTVTAPKSGGVEYAGLNSLFRRAVLNVHSDKKFTDQIKKSFKGYTNLFKGYYRELAGAEAADTLLGKLTKGRIGAAQIGDEPDNGTLGVYDIVLFDKSKTKTSDIKDLTKMLYDKKIDIDISLEAVPNDPPVWGVQSKSWLVPDHTKADISSKWYKVTESSSLLNSLIDLNNDQYNWDRGWHNNIYLLSRNIAKVLGVYQVMYLTGDNRFIWTSDLITEFRKASYYLSFYYQRGFDKEEGRYKFQYPATKEITWQKESKTYTNSGEY